MIKSEVCEICRIRPATKAVECPVHGRHYQCDKCTAVVHKVEELGDAIVDDLKDRIKRERENG